MKYVMVLVYSRWRCFPLCSLAAAYQKEIQFLWGVEICPYSSSSFH
jgi:hypothetical protein